MNDVVVAAAVRTPVGSIGGVFKDVPPEELLRVAFQGAMDVSGVAKEAVDEVIAGQAKQTTDAPNIARVSALMMKIPEGTPAYTVHRQCASGMQAMLSGMQQIQCGYSDVVLVGAWRA